MERTSVRELPSFMYRINGVVDRWLQIDEADNAIKELLRFENPLIKSVLRDIKRVLVQPQMTLTDRRRLHHYKESNQRALDELFEREDYGADFAFKLLIADEKATDLETKFVVQYTSDRTPYDQVIAITYAWHESDNKKKYEVARQDGEPSITLELGVEWDVNAVLETLAELSKGNWIWMDQFSLIQKKVTTEALASDIPTIYRNVRVVAFLPYRVCSKLLSRIKKFRDDVDPDVSAALAEVMFHDLVCKCTDGLYGWLSRLWTWQELMLASSLRFVWGLGKSKWARRGILGDVEPSPREEEEKHSLSRLWTPAKSVGRLFKDSVTTLSVSDQPITKLMNELTKRNTASVLVPKEQSATLSMGYYFCMRLLCGAEIYMPSASRIAPINCLKVLQQIASTGRKGGRVYDCYYAASAFIDDTGFLPKKKRSIAERNQQDNMDDLNDGIALREAYIRLYEREHARLRLPEKYQNVLDDPKAVLQEYTELYIEQHNRFPDLNSEDNAVLRQAFIDLYHEVHNTALVKYTGAPVSTEYFIEEDIHRLELESFMDNFLPIQNESYKADFHPIVWQTQIQYRHNLQRIISLIESLPQMPMQGGLPNAFVLSGMNEDMFCENTFPVTRTTFSRSNASKLVGRLTFASIPFARSQNTYTLPIESREELQYDPE